jgi:hypothetical protein
MNNSLLMEEKNLLTGIWQVGPADYAFHESVILRISIKQSWAPFNHQFDGGEGSHDWSADVRLPLGFDEEHDI